MPKDEGHTETATRGGLSPKPSQKLVIFTCMDCRIDPMEMFGVEIGAAHVLRNAGGVLTDDVIRSMMLSQRLLGTDRIAVVQHTECGLSDLDEAAIAAEVRADIGVELPFKLGGFTDVEESVRTTMTALRRNPLLPHRTAIEGYVYNVRTGVLRAVPEALARSVDL